ncbi:thiamine pyrophosphate-dependent dehydrogenase E1 component subunit alpha [Clostridium algoriphilum]|uniref:thiamine pyrophosphate-dependent dehydrogenase E1 component subunit alpha n=1 Tax=Clostridium algoriphilum TaxID=198347 RepID=UPI001CF228B9|nr:thiamine pyrophosphate-dependent dehydrogenase E1 component subunit alpha [Clostridium algoriphilum]MCB2292599.1 thiamine pyrophosphate-dependent dehydrogenase E1 component subunit alpha [Clostridium algoriphilum]
MNISKNESIDMYKTMLKIRKFEEVAIQGSAEGKIPGFIHLYIGEEAIATGVCSNLREDDYITSTHRGHGHIISKGADIKLMMAELFGKATGICKGRGGSMHICDASKGILGANGIVGAGHDLVLGAGLSAQYRGTDQVAICFFGDASTNQGTFHESLNLASVWKLPIVYVCENNGYGISMSQKRHMAITDVANRGASYNIPGVVVDGNDVLAVSQVAADAIKRAREGKGPTIVECKTYRQRGHFEGDPGTYKPTEEQAAWVKKDPIPRFEKYMLEKEILSEKGIKEIQADIDIIIKEALEFAENSPWPEVESALTDVYTDIIEEAR